MKRISLNCVILLWQKPSPEIAHTVDRVLLENITGGVQGPYAGYDLSRHLQQVVFSRLRLGQRVWIDTRGLSLTIIRQLIRRLHDQDIDVFSLGESSSEIRDQVETLDQKAKIIERPPADSSLLDWIQQRFSGITVVPDVHGDRTSLKSALGWASERKHFVVFLGDLISYGPRSLSCVNMAYEWIVQGQAALIIGNHEHKIWKHLVAGHTVDLSTGNQTVVAEFNQLTRNQQNAWRLKLSVLMNLGRNHLLMDRWAMAHAAIMPDMWKQHGQYLAYGLAREAMLGTYLDQSCTPDYNWCNYIPRDHYAVVGHNCRGSWPLTYVNSQQGSTIFLDTGSGKTGPLTTMDLNFTTEGLEFSNFNQY